MTFEDFNLCGAFINALEEKGYTYPPPIEKETIPFILSGKDIAATVKTDTAKAFCISGFGNAVTNRSQIRTAWSNRICVIISHSRKKGQLPMSIALQMNCHRIPHLTKIS